MNKNSYPYRIFNSLKHLVITTFLALILYFFMIPINTQLPWVTPIMQVILILMFTTSMYIPFWEYGDKDSNLVSFNRKEKDILSGIKIALVAIIPYLLSNVLLVVYKLGTTASVRICPVIYEIINVQFIYLIQSLISMDKITEPSWISILVCMLLPFYTVIVAQIAYVLGYKHISIKEKLIYKSKK